MMFALGTDMSQLFTTQPDLTHQMLDPTQPTTVDINSVSTTTHGKLFCVISLVKLYSTTRVQKYVNVKFS